MNKKSSKTSISLLSTTDLKPEEIYELFKTAQKLKQKRFKPLLKGISMAMIFQKPSTRTRVSFEVAMTELGGHALYLGSNDLQLSRGETISDTAKVLGRYVDIIMARVFSHEDVIALAAHSGKPVINGLSDSFHPCQVLADMFTLWERQKDLTKLKIAYVGDGDNNMTNSLAIVAMQLGMHCCVASPALYAMKKDIIKEVKILAEKHSGIFDVTTDPFQAVKNADVVVTDVWLSMGRTDREKRLKALQPYQVNKKLLESAKKNVYIMHCLPAHRNEEITDEIIDGPQSIVWDEAENRLHIQKAIILKLLNINL